MTTFCYVDREQQEEQNVSSIDLIASLRLTLLFGKRMDVC